jgi:hypothetical protein
MRLPLVNSIILIYEVFRLSYQYGEPVGKSCTGMWYAGKGDWAFIAGGEHHMSEGVYQGGGKALDGIDVVSDNSYDYEGQRG